MYNADIITAEKCELKDSLHHLPKPLLVCLLLYNTLVKMFAVQCRQRNAQESVPKLIHSPCFTVASKTTHTFPPKQDCERGDSEAEAY